MKDKLLTIADLAGALRRAIASLTRERNSAVETSAGFVFPDSPGNRKEGARVGMQVFVKVAVFSESLLKAEPLSGGLACYSKKSKGRS